MELQIPTQHLGNPNNSNGRTNDSQSFLDDIDSSCSSPYVSAPSSPGHIHGSATSGPFNGGFFYSAPASPLHFSINSSSSSSSSSSSTSTSRALKDDIKPVPFSHEFEFSARFGSLGSGHSGSMSSADELFLNGKIRPMKLSTHLERPQTLSPLLDLEEEDDGETSARGRQVRDKSVRRRTRSMSPLTLRSRSFDEELGFNNAVEEGNQNEDVLASGSSSRSSSAGRSSKRWVFLKDFLYRSKSEGRSSSNSNRFWSSISFSPGKEKKSIKVIDKKNGVENQEKVKKAVNGVGKRRRSVVVGQQYQYEIHYMASRAQAEEMRKRTYLPYKQGLLGCLGFSSKGYGAMNGFARALNPVFSR